MIKNYADSLLKFLGDSPCNFFAVDTIRRMLDENGFHELRIADDWNLALGGGRYYVVKNDSAIFAFTMGKKPISETGVKVIAAHSDSPCFRIKPNPVIKAENGIIKLNTVILCL